MKFIVEKIEDFNGFRLVKEIKNPGIKMYMMKEEGQKNLTIKFTVDRIKIPIFNLISLVYETDLYD